MTYFKKGQSDLVKKCMDYEGEGVRPRGSREKIWTDVVRKDCQTRHLNKEDATWDCSLKGRKSVKVLNNRK